MSNACFDYRPGYDHTWLLSSVVITLEFIVCTGKDLRKSAGPVPSPTPPVGSLSLSISTRLSLSVSLRPCVLRADNRPSRKRDTKSSIHLRVAVEIVSNMKQVICACG